MNNAPLGQGVEDFGNMIIASLDRFMTRMINEGGLVDMAKGAVDKVSNTVAKVASAPSETFSAFANKLGQGEEPAIARSKQQEIGIDTSALPQQAVAAVHNVTFKNAEIVASQMVDVPSGTAVSPTAVGYSAQVQQQGIAMV